MTKFILEVVFFAITITFLLAWGYVKKQRKKEDLIDHLYRNCENRILKGLENRNALSKKEMEGMIQGTKASLFWSQHKVILREPGRIMDKIIDDMIGKGLIEEESSGKKSIYRLKNREWI